MLAAIRPDTRLVFIANPNNPTGTLVDPTTLRSFVQRVPDRVGIVLDEAYFEYLPAYLRADSLAWIHSHPNLIVTRTFSKAYGLAGLRVGYAVAHASVADLLNRVRQPFNVNGLGLVAARAALADEDHLARSLQVNREGLEQLGTGLAALGVKYIPSHANFLTCELEDAASVNRALLGRGIIVRPIAGYGLPRHLRVSVGLAAENRRFLDALEDILRFDSAGS